MNLDDPRTETTIVLALPKSEWYKYTLACGHTVYSKVRFTYEKPHAQAHKIKCPACDLLIRHRSHHDVSGKKLSTAWNDVDKIEAASNDEVSDVSSGTAFVLPARIMRLDIGGTTSGNPFPYTSKDREY